MDWQVISSLAIAAATIALVYVTWTLAQETTRMREANSQPHVIATIEPNLWSLIHFDLRIDNSGNAPAYDINIEFDPALPSEDGIRKDFGVPLKSVSVLRPGQSVASYLSEYAAINGARFKVTVSWKRDPAAKKREMIEYTLDMNVFENISRLGDNPLVQLAREIKHLRDDWRRVASGRKRIATDVFDSHDRQRQSEKMAKQREERLKNAGHQAEKPPQ